MEGLSYLDQVRLLTNSTSLDYSITEQIKRHKVSHLQCTPSLARVLTTEEEAKEAIKELKMMMVGGEALTTSLAKELINVIKGELHNMYGPTETTIWSSTHKVEANDRVLNTVTIGKPIANTQIYIVNEALELVPVGVAGELLIAGEGVVKGYFQRPELTSEKFIANPFSKSQTDKLYRTGDLARWLDDGTIEFLGRLDHQVKIRGFRIELGEIETLLLQHPEVSQAVVIAREDKRDEKKLVAYLVTKNSDETLPSTSEIQTYIRQQLPEYMVPSAVVYLQSMPLTPNAKVDRKALPAPEYSQSSLAEYLAPSTRTEIELAEIWKELLNVKSVGINDNFFELGGHSLLAMQLFTKLRSTFTNDISLRNLLESPTIAQLAQLIDISNDSKHLEKEHLITPLPREIDLPLSFTQERLWFLSQFEPNNPAYNDRFGIKIKGFLNLAALELSFNHIIQRHEALRTNFRLVNSRPIQIIIENRDLKIQQINLSNVAETELEVRLSEVYISEGQKLFNLSEDLLIRVTLISISETEHIVLIVLPHIVWDGWSFGVFVKEMATLYQSYTQNKIPDLPKLPIQYADYAYWQRQWMQGEVFEKQLGYWKEKLAGNLTPLQLPIDKARPPIQTFAGRKHTKVISKSLIEKLYLLSRQQSVTPFMLMLASLQTLLYRYTSTEDILIGTPIANRNHSQIENLIGVFVNTLVLRTDLSGNPSFEELLSRVKEVTLGAYSNQDIPFEALVEKLQPERDLSRTPFFQVMFVMQNTPISLIELQDISLSTEVVDNKTAKFDLLLETIETESGLLAIFEYNTDLFETSTIERLADNFYTLLESIVKEPKTAISNLEILSKKEKSSILNFNNTSRDYKTILIIQKLIENQVAIDPDAIDLEYEEDTLTYNQLNKKANQLAHFLQANFVKEETLVSISVERSFELVIGLLGIIKAGAAYVPIDPSYPKDRISFMLEDAGAAILLTQEHLLSKLPSKSSKIICLDSDWESISGFSTDNPTSNVAENSPAYMIYTSGSTGKPKGAVNTHKGICNRLLWMQEQYQLTSYDKVLQKTPFSFDVSVWEFFWPLMTGASLVIAKAEGHKDSRYLVQLIKQQQVTTLHFVPSMLQVFLEEPGVEDCISIRQVMCSGEALPFDLQERFYQKLNTTTLHNLYGPTEAAIDVTYWHCQKQSQRKIVPIGYPIANTQIHILDNHLQPVPIGVAAELYIAGIGLASHYWNRPDLTDEKFIPNPFFLGERMYRTGDLARWLEDGSIEYLGRIDHQVKIRGFRIELGEIETVLAQHPSVKEVVVVAHQDHNKDKRLVAYVVAQLVEVPSINQLQTFVKEFLPEYMVPSAVVYLQSMPLSPNGKIDRKALPAPSEDRPILENVFVAATTSEEEILTAIWIEVLGIKQVGIDDNFFALGGDSIRSVQVLSQARNYGLNLTLKQLFQAQTIRELAKEAKISSTNLSDIPITTAFSLISEHDKALLPNNLDDAYPVSILQAGMLFHSEYNVDSAIYHDIFSFVLKTYLDVDKLNQAIASLIKRHTILRTTFSFSDYSRPLQLVQKTAFAPLTIVNIRTLSKDEQDKQINEWLETEKTRGFDWKQAPLLRFQIHCLTDDTFYLSLSFHHAILDGWSIASMLTELFQLYNSLLNGEELILKALESDYRDFIALEQATLESKETKEFWTNLLADSNVVRLPRWFSNKDQTPRLYALDLAISQDLSKNLRKLAQTATVALRSVLLAAHLKVISTLTGQTDVITGIVTNGRPEKQDSEQVLGLFLNTVPIRKNLTGGNWLKLIKEVFALEREIMPHRIYPLANIQSLNSGEALFDTFFDFINFHVYEKLSAMTGIEVLSENVFEQTNFAMWAHFIQTTNSTDLILRLNCNLAVLTKEQIDLIGGYYLTALNSMVADPQRHYEKESLLSDDEREIILNSWNATAKAYPDLCIHQLFEIQAKSTPNKIAVVFENKQLTYYELNSKANRLAYHLISLNVEPDHLVGICVERSLEMIIGLLAILKAGAAYVPLDPSYPKDRISFILSDANIKVLLTQEKLLSTFPQEQNIICLDGKWGVSEKSENPKTNVSANNLAYVIYTSGSTGNPKGVMLEHRNVVNFFGAMDDKISFDNDSVWLALTSISFDISVLELLWTLTRGFKVIVQSEEAILVSSSDNYSNENKTIDFSLFYFASDESTKAEDRYKLFLEGAKFADQNGFSSLWVPERHFHAFGGLYPNPSLAASAVAMITNKINIRAGSVVLPLHNPIRVAEEWSFVDNISKGRVGLSFASGWHANDFVFAPDNYHNRREIMLREIETVKKLWRGESVTARNGFGNDVEIKTLPQPVQKDLPVWLTAGGSPETFKIAGQMGINLLTHLLGQSIESLSEKIVIYRQAWKSSGHKGEGYVTLMLHTFVEKNLEYVKEKVTIPFSNYLRSSVDLLKPLAQSIGLNFDSLTDEDKETVVSHRFDRYFETSGLFGTPETCFKIVNQLKAIGVDEIACLIDFGIDADAVLNALDYLNKLMKQSNALTYDYSIAAQIHRHNVTHMQCTPSLGRLIMNDQGARSAMSKLDYLLLGGEALPSNFAYEITQTLPSKLLNMYGPTETTIWSTVYNVEEANSFISIGRPIANTEIYILDQFNQPLPVAVSGELYIGGDGLARGYYQRPELTNERFVPNPFKNNARLYRTGDLARYLPDGNIDFLGRIDHQVKLRGFRIELGEIEVLLAQHPEIKECLAIIQADQPENKKIIAYFIPQLKNSPSINKLRQYLSEKLPEYMIPSTFVPMESWPLTPNGKINRRALPIPTTERPLLKDSYLSPTTETEAKIISIFSQLLEIDQIGIEDNFFELGGNSILSVQLVVKLRETFKVEIPLRTLFDNTPTARKVAEIIDNASPMVEKLDLAAEIVLDESIKPPTSNYSIVTEPNNIFLTGATGFLGAFLLVELINQTNAQIYCLVRAANLELAQERLIERMKFYELWNEAFSSRISVLVGDLSQPRFGLSEETFDKLAANIDVIYHVGATVNFIYSYQVLKPANVFGTQEVLRLASKTKVKPVHFTSTSSVFEGFNGGKTVFEYDEINLEASFSTGYTQTKVVSEKIIEIARQRGLPVSIYRLDLVGGHSKTGVANTSDFIALLIKGCIQYGSAPLLNSVFDLTPVDFACNAIVTLSKQTNQIGKNFHLLNPYPPSASGLFDWVRSFGYDLEAKPFREWQTEITSQNTLKPENALYTLIPFIKELRLDQEDEFFTFDVHQTEEALLPLQIICPKIDTELLHKCLAFFERCGFISVMQKM
ncbi:MAG: amino acid adenylation domain-containing protein [Blastocatellia bacterium]|nr:amino acid adenylation domain-containing protein [Blastocatellia bacterium]